MILVLALFFLMILSFLALGIYQLVPVEMKSTQRNKLDVQAHYVATGAVKHALAWMDSVIDIAPSPLSIGDDFNPINNPFGVTTTQPYERITLANPQAFPYDMNPATLPSDAVGGTPGSPVGPSNPAYPKYEDKTYYPADLDVLRLKTNAFQPGGNWGCNVTIFPDRWTWPHPYTPSANSQPRNSCYTIVSLVFLDANGNGLMDGPSAGEKWALRAKVSVTVDSFAKYAYFTDTWRGDVILGVKNQNRPTSDGPLHTNSIPQFKIDNPNSFWSASVTPSTTYGFTGQISFAGALGTNFTEKYDKVLWDGGNAKYQGGGMVPAAGGDGKPYTNSNVAIGSRYQRLIAGGESQIRNIGRIELPDDSANLAVAAWGFGEQSTIMNQNGLADYDVYVNNKTTGTTTDAAGGIYVKGNVKDMVLEVVDGNGALAGTDAHNSATPTASNLNQNIKFVMDTQITPVLGSQQVSQFSASKYPSNYIASINQSTQLFTSMAPSNYQVGVTTSSQRTTNVNYNQKYTANDCTSNVPYTIQVPKYCTSQTDYVVIVGGQQQYGSSNVQYVCGSNTSNKTSQSAQYSCQKTSAAVSQSAPFNQNYFLATGTQSVDVSQFKTSKYQVATTKTTNLSTNVFNGSFVTSNITGTPYNPTNRVLELKNNGINIMASQWGSASATFAFSNGTSFNTNLAVGAGNIAVIRQSKTDPNIFYVDLRTSTLNGAVNVQGDILGLRGWNKDKRTIGARPAGASWTSTNALVAASLLPDSNLYINGHVRQWGTTQGGLPQNYTNNLGLIAGNIGIKIGSTANLQGPTGISFDNLNNPLYLYAVLLAGNRTSSGGQFFTQNLTDLGAGSQKGLLRLFGGLIQKNQGNLADQNGNGWAQQYTYDPVNAKSPPPYFPVLADFVIFNYQEDRL